MVNFFFVSSFDFFFLDFIVYIEINRFKGTQDYM